MNTFKARGLVLKETLVGESDKIVTLLLKDIGKVSVSAKGSRKVKSKFLAGTQLFAYSDFIICDSRKYLAMTQIDIIKSFYDIRNDYDRLCNGNYMLELTDKVIMPNMPCDEILFLLLKALSALEKGNINPRIVCKVFEFKFLQINGYGAELDCCFVCGNTDFEEKYFGSHGLVCKNCRHFERKTVKVSDTTAYVINYILSQEITELFKFKVSDNVLRELSACSEIFLNSNLDVNLRSKQFII